MHKMLKRTLLTVPIYIWIAQLLYVAVTLAVYFILVSNLNSGSVSMAATRLYSLYFVIVMVTANIIWRLSIKNNHYVVVVIAIIAAFAINTAISQLFVLQSAHSSLDNYYKFRGCSQLISKSSDSASCRLPSGETIKLVTYQNKWYLDGDLPNEWF